MKFFISIQLIAVLLLANPARADEQVRDWKETYCLDHYGPAGTLTECLVQEAYAGIQLSQISAKEPEKEYSDRTDFCTRTVTGGRSLGSQEYVSQYKILQCVLTPHRKKISDACIGKITGSLPKNDIIHWQADADRVAKCSNDAFSKASKLPAAYEYMGELLEETVVEIKPRQPAVQFSPADTNECSGRAQMYQDRFERDGRVNDFVCYTKALKREIR